MPDETESVEQGGGGRRRRRWWALGVLMLLLAGGAASVYGLTRYESYTSVYDATYVGNDACTDCHSQVAMEWESSPHALMVRRASQESVVGNFRDHEWTIPEEYQRGSADAAPVARMAHDGDSWVMSLMDPESGAYRNFSVDYVVGYQYRQVYLHEEPGGVLRRLPLQWSVERGEFFPYWNFQEKSPVSLPDLWAQMRSQNSAWNLFCARCHVTNLNVVSKNDFHTEAETHWVDLGIGCESCHGPGSHHVNYFEHNYVNRIAAFVNNKIRGEPVAYIASASKLSKGEAMSVCARCHGPDIMLASTETYRQYEPGYSGEGRVNDLSPHFKEFPLQPGRMDPTVECWDDGRPKGIGMLFRSFIESSCYDHAEVRCYDCHNPHANKLPTKPGKLQPSQASNDYCLNCHSHLKGFEEQHSHHAYGTEGSYCYDCHMPHTIQNLVTGVEHFTRTHTMSTIPNPESSVLHGLDRAPNACNECHADESAQWAVDQMRAWWPRGDG